MSPHALRGLLILLAATAACGDGAVTPIDTTPSLDAQVRQALSSWAVVPILPPSAPDPALVDLGRSLFFDKILSGNRDVSCASCHKPSTGTGDGMSLAIGTGAQRTGATPTLGEGRQFTPRNAAPLFGASLRPFYLFWDGRVSDFGGQSNFATPAGPALPSGLASILAAQAMIPVTNRVEMRGNPGDHDVLGNANELAILADSQYAAIWSALIRRVLAVNAYVQKFNAAYPSVPVGQLGFQHAANAIAAFEVATFARTNSPFDRYLARDDNALSVDAKRGALLFFGKARCSQCHNGPLIGGQQFANTGAPQLGPGTGKAAPLDAGRGDPSIVSQPQFPNFFFRVPPLRNVELTAPYMHDGAYPTLEAVVRHYNNVDSAVKAYDVSQLDPSLRSSYHGDAATIGQLLSSLDGRIRQPLGLTPDEQRQLVAFLKSLTDPSARDLNGVMPAAVPSGLPVSP
ncbi:MAG TPA: cytochrome c peroxidase [Gemmatimonadaceae bacterium]|nr:cytochrome c peroxidase [Gemmatimonadaceae bacterium]